MPELDPQVIHLLDMIRKTGRQPFQTMTPEAARIAYTGNRDVMQLPAEDVAVVRDVTLPDGLVLRIYRGSGTGVDAQLPCLLFLHGGGWVIGDLDSHDVLCRRLANLAGICVVAADYRLAPGHRFPAALDDSLTALQWIDANAGTLSIARDRIAVGGDSAGGNLAAVLALMGRDGTAPRTMFQALIYPVVDLTAASQSYQRVTSGLPLTAATMHYFIEHYTPDPADRTDWRASPLLASSLAGTPPALVVTVGHDPLCDEGLAYAKRLEDDGVRVTSLHLSDQIHGMLLMGKLIDASNTVVTMVGAVLGAALHCGPAAR
ncbi:alpha/beta hydrolase [Actimicrobium sp. CCC2.4]|uniref:alpha/beta hydrolase n=1 Tax=Actimicrobium sp. CCC2.4 TaxID=3048606 RepID=UPI002AC8AB15|nr:alpha/beta hydrolase [Actimicrobium sp. CCC2.4]MEB0134012.1 alpha/beta hydrolase [Actimicrobium sp. CCC2.4]WPX31548.1 alpha/beta hydrolase [Actimicrobium sp. CCC2.4]